MIVRFGASRFLADRQNAHALAVLVLLQPAVDTVFLLVLGLDVAADVLAVDLDGAPELHFRSALADGLLSCAKF